MRISESELRRVIRQVIKEGSIDQKSIDSKFNQVLASKIDLESLMKATISDVNSEFYENIYAQAFYAKYKEIFGEKPNYDERSYIRSLLRDLMKKLIASGHAGF